MKAFFEKHPLLKMLLIDIFITAAALLLAIYLNATYHWPPSTIIFSESLVLLLIAVSTISGNGSLREIDIYCHEKRHLSYLDSYAFAITIGIPGAILFFISGYFPNF